MFLQIIKILLNVFADNKDIFGYDFDGNYNNLLENIKGVDLVFNSLHGGDGENGVIQKFFEDNNINFTGSGSKSSEKAMDKHLTKKICYENEILTPSSFSLCLVSSIDSNLPGISPIELVAKQINLLILLLVILAIS